MKTISGVTTFQKRGRQLGWLEPVAEKWVAMIAEYSNAFPAGGEYEDAIYWYNERCNVGVFAAAAWSCGLMAMEEYASAKRRKAGGRTDLYICSKTGTEEATIEAKYVWRTATALDAESADDWLGIACTAARQNTVGSLKIGCVFIMPRFPKGAEASARDIDQLLDRCRDQSAKVGLLAWCFPASSRRLRDTEASRPFRYMTYPGIVLAMRVAGSR